jgi:hypothetical protein
VPPEVTQARVRAAVAEQRFTERLVMLLSPAS